MKKKMIKKILQIIYELIAIVYPYSVFLELINAKDEVTVTGTILMVIYVLIATRIFEWCFNLESQV